MREGLTMSENINWLPILAAAVTGGLAGSLFNHVVQWWRRPELGLSFHPSEPGCEVETLTTGERPFLQRYLRLKITNFGKSTANNVSAYMVRIKQTPPNEAGRDFAEEVVDFKVSLTGDIMFRLPPKAHRFVDVCLAIHRPASGNVDFSFDFHRNPVRLDSMRRPGSFDAEIFVSADGAKPLRASLQWSWDGTFKGLRIVRWGYMSV
jgi:hypothetical protein